MATYQAQPDAMPFLKFRFDDVVCIETGGLSPSNIIPDGAQFTLKLEFGVEGLLAGLLVGQAMDVFHHLTRIEDGNVFTLAGGTFNVPAGNPAHIVHNSGPHTAGAGNLTIPAGFASGTFRWVTHVHPQNPAITSVVAAFHDSLMTQITP